MRFVTHSTSRSPSLLSPNSMCRVAETSITIEDVVCVIDTARVKENRQDEVNQMPTLVSLSFAL